MTEREATPRVHLMQSAWGANRRTAAGAYTACGKTLHGGNWTTEGRAVTCRACRSTALYRGLSASQKKEA